ncbi:MAG: hypothetical protein QXZ09_09485, partial [Candidatus Methanomethylicaceae archaeon]
FRGLGVGQALKPCILMRGDTEVSPSFPQGDRSRGLGQPGAVKVSRLTYRPKNPRILMRGGGQMRRMDLVGLEEGVASSSC